MSTSDQPEDNLEKSVPDKSTKTRLVDSPRFRADIEGLRAIAILLVIAYHAHIPGFEGGYIGVDMFFVLSGYLITWLLVDEAQKTGTVNFFRFYSRRARRLLPALLLVLVVTVAISRLIYAPIEQTNLAVTALSTATYLSNAYFAQEAVNYLGAAPETNPLLHTWSLSVEEQFYLVWPLFVAFAVGVYRPFRQKQGTKPKQSEAELSRSRIVLWMVGITVISFGLSLYLTGARQSWAFFLSPPRAWEFSIGALGILVPSPKGSATRSAILGWLGMLGIAASTALFNERTLFPGIAALLPAISTLLVLRSCGTHSKTRLARSLQWPVFQNIGRVSYSWYLWHWPVLVFASVISTTVPLLVRLGLMLFAWLLAEASYRWLENPVRHSAFLSKKPARSMAMGLFITAFSICLSLGWIQVSSVQMQSPEQAVYTRAINELPVVYKNGCHVDFFRRAPQIEGCTIEGKGNNPAKVVLFGDSHATQWYAPLAALARDKGWQFTSMTKSACSYVDQPLFLDHLGRQYTECPKWQQSVLEVIQDIQPDLVIVASWTEQPFSEREWIEGTDRMMKVLSEGSKQVIALRDPPMPGFDVPLCMARPHPGAAFGLGNANCELIEASGQLSAQQAYLALELTAEKYSNVYIIDINSKICDRTPCELIKDNVILYRDSHHLTKDFALTLADPLYEQLVVASQQNDLSLENL